MRSKYPHLDNAIKQVISEGVNTFTAIWIHRKVRKHTVGESFRVVDRRLQALRKNGDITYSRKTGWQIVKEKGNGD